MNKKEKWIEDQAQLLWYQCDYTILRRLKTAIRLGLDNADNEELKENEYIITDRGVYYEILVNGCSTRFLGKLWYDSTVGITKEQAYKAAQAVIKSLQEDDS